jgi:hypothetical protein
MLIGWQNAGLVLSTRVTCSAIPPNAYQKGSIIDIEREAALTYMRVPYHAAEEG